MCLAGFYPLKTGEKFWANWSRYLFLTTNYF
jgi:hypothetical protein